MRQGILVSGARHLHTVHAWQFGAPGSAVRRTTPMPAVLPVQRLMRGTGIEGASHIKP